MKYVSVILLLIVAVNQLYRPCNAAVCDPNCADVERGCVVRGPGKCDRFCRVGYGLSLSFPQFTCVGEYNSFALFILLLTRPSSRHSCGFIGNSPRVTLLLFFITPIKGSTCKTINIVQQKHTHIREKANKCNVQALIYSNSLPLWSDNSSA